MWYTWLLQSAGKKDSTAVVNQNISCVQIAEIVSPFLSPARNEDGIEEKYRLPERHYSPLLSLGAVLPGSEAGDWQVALN